jgi:hypothetical protein
MVLLESKPPARWIKPKGTFYSFSNIHVMVTSLPTYAIMTCAASHKITTRGASPTPCHLAKHQSTILHYFTLHFSSSLSLTLSCIENHQDPVRGQKAVQILSHNDQSGLSIQTVLPTRQIRSRLIKKALQRSQTCRIAIQMIAYHSFSRISR